MIDSQKIEIATIKDLKGIFFYYVGSGLNKKISGLSIVYGDNKKLDYDYTYEYYKDYVRKVLQVYRREKDKNNIYLYDDLTKEVVNSFDVLDIEIISDKDYFRDSKINLSSISNIDIKNISEYFNRIVLSIMEIVTGNNENKISNIIGRNNKYMISCIKSDGSLIEIPISCVKKDDGYEFKMYFPDIDILKGIDGNIRINEDGVFVNFVSNNNKYIGSFSYLVKDNEYREIIINDQDEVLYYGDPIENISQNEKDLVNSYGDMLGMDNVISNKISDSWYVISCEDRELVDEDIHYNKKVGYVVINHDYASVIYINTLGILKYDETLNVSFMKEQREIRFIPFDIDDKHYILKEIVCDYTDKMSGEYQGLLNKYCYYILEVDNNDLRLPINIISEYRLDCKNINNLVKVKKYIRDRKELI